MVAAKNAHSAFLKCESIRLLSLVYRRGIAKTQAENEDVEKILSNKARIVLKEQCKKVALLMREVLGDSNLHKTKHRDEGLHATKHILNYAKSQEEVILTISDLTSLQDVLKSIKGESKGAGVKQLCSQLFDTILDIIKHVEEHSKGKHPTVYETSKSSKKKKKTKK